jgi:ribosomal protein L17
MSEEIKHEKCARCKTWRLPAMFLNEAGRKLKTCSSCRTTQNNYTANNKCDHKRIRGTCKDCKKDIKSTIGQWIYYAKENDKQNNRYDADNFIDKCFLRCLIEEYPNCYYEDCKVNIQSFMDIDKSAMIERINNTIGHIKSNCVLCCIKCSIVKK